MSIGRYPQITGKTDSRSFRGLAFHLVFLSRFR